MTALTYYPTEQHVVSKLGREKDSIMSAPDPTKRMQVEMADKPEATQEHANPKLGVDKTGIKKRAYKKKSTNPLPFERQTRGQESQAKLDAAREAAQRRRKTRAQDVTESEDMDMTPGVALKKNGRET